jgi:hypothetical protein
MMGNRASLENRKKWNFASKRTKNSGKKQRTKDVAKKVVG